MHHTLHKDLSRADYDHVIGEVFLPSDFGPQRCAHGSTDAFYILIETASQDVGLLEHEVDRIDLLPIRN